MDIAIEMHARAVAAKRDWRWWVPYVMTFVGGLVTALAALRHEWLSQLLLSHGPG
jgi:hypothetical protein